MGGLAISTSGNANFNLEISGSSNSIKGGAYTASDQSNILIYLNTSITLTGVTVTTSLKALALLKLVGESNTVSGLTLIGKDQSFISYNMHSKGYADTGRTVVL